MSEALLGCRLCWGMAVLLALCLGACVAPREGTAPAAPPPRAERPTYRIGDKWLRDDGAYELLRIENDRYIFVAGPGKEIHLTRDLAIARVQRGDYFAEFDPPHAITWPLEVGKSGQGYGRVRGSQRGALDGVQVNLSWAVEAYEEVQVPAGMFKAFRILYEVRYSLGAPTRFASWYAPEVRQLVKVGNVFARAASTPLHFTFQLVALDQPIATPLQIALPTIPAQFRVSVAGLVATGTVTGGPGVAQVTATLNGQEVFRQDDTAAPKPEVALRVPLTLQAGRNVLLVTARDRMGATTQVARTVYYEPPVPVVAPVVVPPQTPAPPPFRLTLAAPADQARVEHHQIGLAGVATGGTGVRQVVVTLNGAEVRRLGEATPQPSLALDLPLTLREGQNTVVVTATEASGTLHQEVRTVVYVKSASFALEIRYPEDNLRFTQETTVLAGLATSGKGIARVTVTLNGQPVHEQANKAVLTSMALAVPLTLRAGTNAIVVTVTEPDGTARQALRTVTFEPPVAAVAPAPAPALPTRQPDRWAVVVGVGTYEHPGIPRLRYTKADAEAIHRLLVGPAGFKPEHVLLLTDTSERKPTLRNLKWALGTFLARSARKDDTVLIFFAGHGAPEIDPTGAERDGLAKYLVPLDADPDDLYATALPMEEIRTIFDRIEAERIVVLLDACYSGAAGGRTFAAKRSRAGAVNDLFLERLTRAKGRAILTAARPTEVSVELAELGHGLFTYYLLRGLEGAADLNRDGIVSLQELYEYVEQEVTQKSRALGANQHPVMKGELEGVLPLVKVGGK